MINTNSGADPEICEAAVRLGEKAAELAPSQPWGDIRGLGNRLRHAYDCIDLDILWNTVRDRLPSLKADAEQALMGLKAKADRIEPCNDRSRLSLKRSNHGHSFTHSGAILNHA